MCMQPPQLYENDVSIDRRASKQLVRPYSGLIRNMKNINKRQKQTNEEKVTGHLFSITQ